MSVLGFEELYCPFGVSGRRHCRPPEERNVFDQLPTPTVAPSIVAGLTPAPTVSPSPTSSPRPSGAPTSSPAPTSSAAPTSSPAPTTSPTASAAPTDVPIPTSSPAPTFSPPPTGAPTSSASPTSSAAPTSSPPPTTSPTASAAPSGSTAPTSINDDILPVPDGCKADANGDFGDTDPNNANQILSINYRYQVQTTASLRAPDLNNRVLFELEKALSDILIPPFFNGVGDCQFNITVRFLQDTLEPPIGLLTAPMDRIVLGGDGVRCETDLVPGAARCFKILGGFTLLADEDISWAEPLALLLTREAMNDGDLNNVNADVVDVRFLEALNSTLVIKNSTLFPTLAPIGNDDTLVGIEGPLSSDIPGWSWALIGTGVVAAILAILFLLRNLREQSHPKGSFDPVESTNLRTGNMQAPLEGDEGVAQPWSPLEGDEGAAQSWKDVGEPDDVSTYSDPLLSSSRGSRNATVV